MPQDFPSRASLFPKISSSVIKLVVAAVILIILLVGSVYTISPEEVGVILRFGKYVRTTEPGLHFKLPLGMEGLT